MACHGSKEDIITGIASAIQKCPDLKTIIELALEFADLKREADK